jgi:hypothetical protein
VFSAGAVGEDEQGKLVEGTVRDRTKSAMQVVERRLATVGLDWTDGEFQRTVRCTSTYRLARSYCSTTQAYILISVSGTCHHLPLEVRAGLCRVQPSVCGGAAQGRASPSEDLRRRGGAVRWDRRGALRGEYGYTCIWGSAPVHPHLLRESADPARLRYCGRLQPKVMGPLWTT